MPSTAFAARTRALFERSRQVCGLDYPFTLPRMIRGLGAARLVSTPSRRTFSVRAWLGIAIAGFPEFEQFCIAGFPASTQVFLKSVASAIPPRPRGWLFTAIYHRGANRNLHVSLRRRRSWWILRFQVVFASFSAWAS